MQTRTTKRQFAELLGIAASRVTQLVERGLPVAADGRIQVRSALRWVAEHASSDGAGWVTRRGRDIGVRAAELLLAGKTCKCIPSSKAIDPTAEFLTTRKKRESLRLDREGFEYELRRGKYVDRQEVEDAAFRRARDERDALLAWPNRIASVLAAELNVDERALHTLLEKHLRDFLSERSEVGPLLETARQ